MMAGQTINDRLLAARHSLAGQGLAKSVCKATTEEMIGPKKKHLDYLVHCTNEPNVSIPHLANLLIERSQNANWIVVYKALLTVHHLLAYGNERFMQYLASSNSTFNLSNFLDKGGVQGAVGARIGYDMSPFIRRYAKYLNDKALSYRTVAFDFCKVKRGKEEGSLRSMNADKLLKTLPVLQAQLDGLLEFDCQANDLSNGVINMCFMLLFRDLIRLFACYNDGIINLLEKYFDMNKKQCKDALDLYKKFLVRMDKVGEFLKVAENVGIDKGDIPDLTKAPSSLLDALEGHLASLEGRKGSAANTPTQTSSNQKNVKSGVSALSSTSSSFGTAAASTRFDTHTNGIDESVKAQALAEEEAAMNQYKQQSKLTSPTGSITATNPFLSSPTNSQANIVDLFQSSNQQDHHGHAQTKASDDLLQLGNPFADMFSGGGGAGAAGPQIQQQDQQQTNMWMSNGFNGTTQTTQMGASTNNNTFVSDSNFSSVFGATEPAGSYYLQAAMMDQSTMPNPFLNDPQAHPKISDVNQLQKINKPSGPPQRPPPPGQSGINQAAAAATAATAASPAHSITATVPIAVQPNKSAFDDLNDTIRMQLGGSPAKQSMCSSPSLMQQQQQQQQQPQMSGYGGMMQQQPIYSSPAKQSMGTGGIGGGGGDVGGFDALGDVLKPSGPVQTTSINNTIQSSGNILTSSGGHQQHHQQQQQNAASSTAGTGKVLTGDLDSSLASLAENLTINKSASAQVKGVQWNSPKNTAKPGSSGWSPQPMAATTGAGYRPMAQGMTVSPAPSTLHHPFVHASYPAMTPFLPQGMPIRPGMMTGGGPGGVPMAAAPGMTMMGGASGGGGMPTQQMGLMSSGGGGQQPQQMMLPQGQQSQQIGGGGGATDQNGKNIQLDPFGAF